MKKFIFMAGAMLVLSAAATVAYKAYTRSQMTSLMKANLNALTQNESRKCPDPYDVPNHYPGYRQRTGYFAVGSTGSITIGGKSFPVNFATPGSDIKVSYEIGHCDNVAQGACCDHTKIGDIINVVRIFF